MIFAPQWRYSYQAIGLVFDISGDGWEMTSHLPWRPGIYPEMGGWWRHTYLDDQEYVRRWVGDAEDSRAAESRYVLVWNVCSQHLLDWFRGQVKVKIFWDLQTMDKIKLQPIAKCSIRNNSQHCWFCVWKVSDQELNRLIYCSINTIDNTIPSCGP